MRERTTEVKVGLFTFLILIVLFWATIRVADRTSVTGRGYDLTFEVDSATGLKKKAPVELAGVAVGVVKEIDLVDSRKARIRLRLNPEVKLPVDSKAKLRSRGYLGETYVELVPGSDENRLSDGDEIKDSTRSGDLNDIISQFSEIGNDVKAITGNMRNLAGDSGAPVNNAIHNLEEFTEAIKELTLRNTENIDRIASNMAALTQELRELIEQGRQDVEHSIENISSITGKINRGEGTIGKLVNDEETVEKLNESLDGLNETLGGFNKLETQLGFHTEFLGESEDFKNYISLSLRPVPDKALLIDLVSDPDPTPKHVLQQTSVTVGGATTNVTTDTSTTNRNSLLFSVQLAKQFYDFQIRGGIIESTGGLGLDYDHGPFGVHFSAFDFPSAANEKVHLKLLGDVDVTKNFFVVGGADDILNPLQKTDWFVGAGFKIVEDDFKKLARFTGGSSLLGK